MLADELDLPDPHPQCPRRTTRFANRRAARCRPLGRLDRLGLVSERLIAVHAVHLTMRNRTACRPGRLDRPLPGVQPETRQRHRSHRTRPPPPASTSPSARTGPPATTEWTCFPTAPGGVLAKGAAATPACSLRPMCSMPRPWVEPGFGTGIARSDRSSPQGGGPGGLRSGLLRNPAPLRRHFAPRLLCRTEQVSDVWVGGQRVVEARQVLLALHTRLMPSVGAWQNRCRQSC